MLMQIFLIILFVALNVVGASSESTSSVSWFCSMHQEWCALSLIHQTVILSILVGLVLWIAWRWIKGGSCDCKCLNDDTVHKL